MSNDKLVAKLSKKLEVTLEYSDKLDNKHSTKPDKTKLKNLAKKIRKNLEDVPFEASAHSNPGI